MEPKRWLVAAAVACGALAGWSAVAQEVAIEVLSSRADLVTGGDALVRVTGSAAPTVTVNGTDVSTAFAEGSDGGWISLALN